MNEKLKGGKLYEIRFKEKDTEIKDGIKVIKKAKIVEISEVENSIPTNSMEPKDPFIPPPSPGGEEIIEQDIFH